MAAHDLCVGGYAVHVYEMTDRLGEMMVWGIPVFRLPLGIIAEDVERLMQQPIHDLPAVIDREAFVRGGWTGDVAAAREQPEIGNQLQC